MDGLKIFETDKHCLKNEDMDTLHQEFLDIYNSVDVTSNKSFKVTLALLIEHTKRHFNEEETLMDLHGYPTVQEHKEEHAKVLAEMEYFLKISHSSFGKKMLKAYFLEKIPYWFDLHLASMDSDLAYFLKQQQSLAQVS